MFEIPHHKRCKPLWSILSPDRYSNFDRSAPLKCVFAAFVFVICSLPTFAQPSHSRAEVVQHYCRASEVTDGPEVDRIRSIEARLGPIIAHVPGPHIHVAVVDSAVINAWNVNLNPHESLICIPVAMVRFMGESEGEVAFIFAHETGHALDITCKSNEGRAEIAPPTLSGAISSLLGGSGRNLLAEQRTCETRADAIGFALFTTAGYNPFDAAGAFGRLEMYQGDTSTGAIARLVALGKTHPMTPDRIAHMRALLNERSIRETGGQ
jgi:predicted Zn-dependent protease